MLILAEIFAFGEGLLLIRYFDRLKSLPIGSSTDEQFWMDRATGLALPPRSYVGDYETRAPSGQYPDRLNLQGYPDAYPELGAEITVVGTFEWYEEDGCRYYRLGNASCVN